MISQVLGLDADGLTWWQAILRALIIYVVALVMVRVGEKRFLGKNTAFDVIIGVMLGSVVSRAITNPRDFVPGIVAGFTLVFVHWTFAWVAFRSDWFGTLVKGSPRTLVEHGEIQWDAMRKSQISRDDLLSALRTAGSVDGPEEVRCARLERSGSVSVLKHEKEPRVVDIRVADGVEHVRLELQR